MATATKTIHTRAVSWMNIHYNWCGISVEQSSPGSCQLYKHMAVFINVLIMKTDCLYQWHFNQLMYTYFSTQKELLNKNCRMFFLCIAFRERGIHWNFVEVCWHVLLISQFCFRQQFGKIWLRTITQIKDHTSLHHCVSINNSFRVRLVHWYAIIQFDEKYCLIAIKYIYDVNQITTLMISFLYRCYLWNEINRKKCHYYQCYFHYRQPLPLHEKRAIFRPRQVEINTVQPVLLYDLILFRGMHGILPNIYAFANISCYDIQRIYRIVSRTSNSKLINYITLQFGRNCNWRLRKRSDIIALQQTMNQPYVTQWSWLK